MPKVKSSRTGTHSRSAPGYWASIRAALFDEPVGLLSLMVALFAFSQAWVYSTRIVCMDYYQFWVVGQAKREMAIGDIYSEDERQRIGKAMFEKAQALAGPTEEGRANSKQLKVADFRQTLETYSTPWLYTTFGSFTGGDYSRDQDRFQLFSLFCFLFAVFSICRLLNYSPAASSLAAVAFLNWFMPTLSDTRVGNVGRVQLALLALFLLVQGRGKSPLRCVWGGFILGCATMFKPNLGFVALTLGIGWTLSSQYRKLLLEIAGMALGGFAAVSLSAWNFGSFRVWLHWAREMPRLMTEYNHAMDAGNFAPSRLLQDYFGFSTTPYVSIFLLAAFLTILIVFWRRGSRQRLRAGDSVIVVDERRLDMLMLGLGALISLLATQLAWLHYFILVIPAALFLLRPLREGAMERGQMIRRGLATLAVVMIALEPYEALFNITEVVPERGLMVCGGTLMLCALAFYEFVLFSRLNAPSAT